MNPIVEEKKALRAAMYKARARNKSSFKKKYDLEICKQLEAIIKAKNAGVIHAYLPMGKEIDIRPLLQNLLAANVKVITPKTLPKRQLLNLVLHSLDEVEQGVFGTSHPANSSEYTGTYDLIIVPGLAFDENNYRLGYGGGYYDTFLEQHPNAFKVGIFYPFQKVAKVPIEPHDVSLDQILFLES
ncbi:5-formyltetrahydrofolate cyclo-ligase [Polaribacter pacificus]|uniref:5-formyltetrahydrofolate cyclo-ligase n=1 Tax=Polaribacter pacificus TaxID=1775173 RepID=A0A917MB57_9FLAO|nr:5-formyltetrahydrofolate cyclo-ligase [Polaribacter pacificus]GGG89046.1 5-formyltetrahydrofolate cyclo-ligase [Polaribacter pacificus]